MLTASDIPLLSAIFIMPLHTAIEPVNVSKSFIPLSQHLKTAPDADIPFPLISAYVTDAIIIAAHTMFIIMKNLRVLQICYLILTK